MVCASRKSMIDKVCVAPEEASLDPLWALGCIGVEIDAVVDVTWAGRMRHPNLSRESAREVDT